MGATIILTTPQIQSRCAAQGYCSRLAKNYIFGERRQGAILRLAMNERGLSIRAPNFPNLSSSLRTPELNENFPDRMVHFYGGRVICEGGCDAGSTFYGR